MFITKHIWALVYIGRILTAVIIFVDIGASAASFPSEGDQETQGKSLLKTNVPGALGQDQADHFTANIAGISSPKTKSMAGSIDEGHSIRPIHLLPFQQRPEDWGLEGHGISMDSTGEPKSGTTWTERIITELALQLCGSFSNLWCKLGRVEVHPSKPDPFYIWEMLFADTGNVFLHFDGTRKHPIPGFDVEWSCIPLGHRHPSGFAKRYPCNIRGSNPSREQLLACLPRVSTKCSKQMPSRYPDVRRMSIVFRDPRDVVISSRRYQADVQHKETKGLEEFIYDHFEMIVAWQHQRWVWHTTFYKDVSHVMFYEDLKATPSALVNLAAFMGLNCSMVHAYDILRMHRDKSPHGDYKTYNFPLSLIEFMNTTMLTLLPEEMVSRYGLLSSHRQDERIL